MSSTTKPVTVETPEICRSKRCTKCDEYRPVIEFSKDRSKRDGLSSHCKKCHVVLATVWNKANRDKTRLHSRSYMLKANYGITPEQYEAMLRVQGGGCKICGKPCQTGRRLAVDHVKGSDPPQVRGLLCVAHNTGIGLFDHDVGLLENAVDYLNEFAQSGEDDDHVKLEMSSQI